MRNKVKDSEDSNIEKLNILKVTRVLVLSLFAEVTIIFCDALFFPW
jgi:hypothetical protein